MFERFLLVGYTLLYLNNEINGRVQKILFLDSLGLIIGKFEFL